MHFVTLIYFISNTSYHFFVILAIIVGPSSFFLSVFMSRKGIPITTTSTVLWNRSHQQPSYFRDFFFDHLSVSIFLLLGHHISHFGYSKKTHRLHPVPSLHVFLPLLQMSQLVFMPWSKLGSDLFWDDLHQDWRTRHRISMSYQEPKKNFYFGYLLLGLIYLLYFTIKTWIQVYYKV